MEDRILTQTHIWPTLSAIVFDLDGTLFFTDSISHQSYELAVRCIAEQEELLPQVAARLLDDRKQALSQELRYRPSLTQTLQSIGISLVNWGHYQSKIDTSLIEVVPEVVNLINQLSNNYRLFLATNMVGSVTDQILHYLGISDCFAEIFTPDRGGFAKPDPTIYRNILNRYNLHPTLLLSVGDRYDVDLLPALQLGCYVYLSRSKEELMIIETKVKTS